MRMIRTRIAQIEWIEIDLFLLFVRFFKPQRTQRKNTQGSQLHPSVLCENLCEPCGKEYALIKAK